MSEIEKNARVFLDSKNINWQLGLEIFNLLTIKSDLKVELLKRIVELKPQILKRLNIQDQSGDLEKIVQRHSFIIDDFRNKPLHYFDIPLIKNPEDFNLQIFSVLSSFDFFKKIQINKQSKVFGFGSCFAMNLVNYLNHMGLEAQSSVISEDINSPRNNLALLQWAINNKKNFVTNELSKINVDFSLSTFNTNLKNSSHIIFTLGSAFSIVDKNSDEPHLVYSPNSITKIDDIETIRNNLKDIFSLIRKANPKASILITVSPVPIRGVAHDLNPLIANMQSKSILRGLIADLFEKDNNTYYLPIYDLIIGLAPYTDSAIFGKDDGNSRHLDGWVIDAIMRQFMSLIVEQ